MKLNDVTHMKTETTYDPPKPELGKLIVWNAINPPSEMRFYSVKSVDEAKKTIDFLADLQLKDNRITDNAFGLMIGSEDANEEGEITWYEWEDDNGFDLSEVMREEEIELEE